MSFICLIAKRSFFEIFQGDGYIGDCIDIDECETAELGQSVCDDNTEYCINSIGSFTCDCKDGYRLGPNNICINVNECQEGIAMCQTHSTCHDLDGSYACICDQGFTQLDSDTCEDINECLIDNDCKEYDDKCINTKGSYHCEAIDCTQLIQSASLDCQNDKIELNFPKCVFDHFEMLDWYMNGPDVNTGDELIAADCKVRNNIDDSLWLTWSLTDLTSCGTISTRNESHVIYQNALQKTEDFGSNNLISRTVGNYIKFDCAYLITDDDL